MNTMRRMGFSKVNGKWIRGKEKDVETTNKPPIEEQTPGAAQQEDVPPPPSSASALAFPPPQSSASKQRVLIELNQDQLQFIVREVTSAMMSSRSSGESVSNFADFFVVPHILTIHEFLRDISLRIEGLERQLNILNARQRLRDHDDKTLVFKSNTEKLQQVVEAVGRMQGQLAFGADIVQKIQKSLDNLLSQISLFGFKPEPASAPSSPKSQPPRQPFRSPTQPSYPRANAPHLRTRSQGRGRGTGIADRPSTISSSSSSDD